MKVARNWDERSIYYQYLNDISKYPLLEREEEKILIKRVAQGDAKAEHRLVVSNLKFVINIANLYKNQGFSITELINEGNIGLIEAARRFDPGQQIKFISYAVWWIRQAITRAISEKSRLVRISAEKELVLRRFSKTSAGFRQVIGGQQVLDAQDIADNSDYTPDQVEKIIRMGLKHSSLDTPVGEDGDSTILDLTPSNQESTSEQAESQSRSQYLKTLLTKLPDQERLVISLYFGIEEDVSLNLAEIGKMIGLSKERVRQVKENALAHLREMNLSPDLLLAA